MSLKSDSYVISRVLNGDTSAFEFLVRKYQDRIFGLAIKMLGNREDAEEVAQDAFVKAYTSLSDFRRASKFSTWLYRITYNECISKLRKREGGIIFLDAEKLSDPDEMAVFNNMRENDKDERETQVRMALAKLSEMEQVLLMLFYFDNLKIEEISRITGLGQSNVKVKIHRARRKMEKLLGNYFEEITVNG